MRMINFFWGVMFILLGSLFFLANFNIVGVDWGIIFSLWPFLIILIGVYFLPGKVRVIGTLSLTMLLTGVMIYAIQWKQVVSDFQVAQSPAEETTKPDPDFDFEASTSNLTTNLDQEFSHARLNLETTRGQYRLQGIEDQLFELQAPDQPWQYFNLDQGVKGDTGIVDLQLSGITTNRQRSGGMELGFHTSPLWNLKLVLDSTKAVLDLTPFRIDHLQIRAPESDLRLKLGQRHSDQQIDIQGKNSQIRIKLPKDAGSELKLDSPLPMDVRMSGLSQKDSGVYQTSDYPLADKQVKISLADQPRKLIIDRN